ncbi:MAG: galactokinase [Cytophagales bacterium]|nr:galactokinase [Armatimonadota bacterium]
MDRSELIEEARVAFVSRFGHEPEVVGVAPGRVELLGNHTDYNEGFVLTSAIDRGIAIAGCAREVPSARVTSLDQEGTVTFDPSAPSKDPNATWSDYVKGVVDELNKAGATIGGFDALIASNVPSGAGVSSSAALEVATAQLVLSLYPHRLMVDAMGLAKLCQRAENNFVGAPVGVLDQFSSIFGQAGHALFLDCRTLEHRTVRLPADRARILIADSGVKHALALGGGYRERRAQCEEAARWFAARYPNDGIKTLRDVTPEMLEASEGKLEATLAKRARHIVYENMRVKMGAEALQGGNIAAFGEMMSNTHESIRRFFENSAPEVDALVEIAQEQRGVYGAKLSGGGWGGSAVILHEPDITEDLCAALADGYRQRFDRDATLLPTVAAQGAESRRFDDPL